MEIRFRRNFNDWEDDEIGQLLHILEPTTLDASRLAQVQKKKRVSSVN